MTVSSLPKKYQLDSVKNSCFSPPSNFCRMRRTSSASLPSSIRKRCFSSRLRFRYRTSQTIPQIIKPHLTTVTNNPTKMTKTSPMFIFRSFPVFVYVPTNALTIQKVLTAPVSRCLYRLSSPAAGDGFLQQPCLIPFGLIFALYPQS